MPALAFAIAACGGSTKQPPAIEKAAVAATPPPTAPAAPAAPIDSSGFRTAIDLYANRVHAGLYRDGRLIVDAGGLDFLKYIDGGWKTSWLLGTKDEGHPAALVAGLSAMAFLPVDDGNVGDATLSITMRALAPAQRVSLFVNEKPLSTLEVDKASKRYDVNVPAALLHAGDNRVRMTFKGAADVAGGKRAAAAVTSLALGTGRGRDRPPARSGRSPRARSTSAARASGRSSRAAPARACRSTCSSRPARTWRSRTAPRPPAAPCWRRSPSTASRRARFTRATSARAGPTRWSTWAAGGQAARIDLIARGTKGDLAWGEPRVVVKAPAAPAADDRAAKFDHIFVWMVDTLRADKLHAYNTKTRVATPNYDAFAADATRFEWAQVPGTWSLPSHASLLTGVYPTVHRATAHEAKLSKDVPFVAEDMKKAGFKTGMFSSNGYVSSKWGFDRGWDVNRNFIRESLPNGSEYLWKTAKAWLTPIAAKKQFAYLATIEPHVAYTPRKEFLVKYWDKPYVGPIKPVLSGVQLGLIKGGKLKITDNDKKYLEALHDGEISQSDAAFATFVADLKTMGLYEKSAVVVVSDHGDQFYEHGSVGHGDTVYQELVHVPLMIRAPGLFPAGKVVHARRRGDGPLRDAARPGGHQGRRPPPRGRRWRRWRATRWAPRRAPR